MGIVILIFVLIAIILYLIILGSGKARTLQKENNNASSGIIQMAKELNETREERDELKKLRLMEIHNNTVLVNRNRELQEFQTKIIEIMNDKTLLMINQIDKINKLLPRQR